MDLLCDVRPSDSPFVECVWRSKGDGRADPFISMANSTWEMVIAHRRGKTMITVRGPETLATPAHGLPETEFIGITFKPGSFMPDLPPKTVMDRQDLNLPEAGSRSFRLNSSVWQFPNYENADTFVDRLAQAGLLVHDPLIGTILRGQPTEVSPRTAQRRFLQATGLTRGTIHQIERARFALSLLKQGFSILDVVDTSGYFDQPHLTRSLNHFVGLTPAQIIDKGRQERLSFLYKTQVAHPDRMDMPKE